MKHTLAIAQRELSEKKFVFTAAFALAVMVMLIPLFPRVNSQAWRNIYAIGSPIVGIAFAAGMAAILGATIVGREMSDRRLSFYFAKPVAAPAIWFGKLIAAAILVAGTFAIEMVPALISGSKSMNDTWSGEGLTALSFLAIVLTTMFFVAHLLSTIARARSAWALLDFAALGLLGLAGWWVVQPLVGHFAFEMLLFVGKLFGWIALFGVLAAGAYQLAMGRTDRQQSHLALSRFLWPALAIAVAICGLVVWWVVSATPADLTDNITARIAPQGSYAIVAGKASHRRDYVSLFLLNMKSGEYERLHDAPLRGGFSADGKKLISLRSIGGGNQAVGEVVIRGVEAGSRAQETGLYLSSNFWPLNVSLDGNRIAYVTQGVLTVYDVPTKTSLGSVRSPAPNVTAMWFQTPELLRLLTVTPPNHGEIISRALEIYEYDLTHRAMKKTGEYHRTGRALLPVASQDGSRLFVRNPDGPGTTVLDARSGAPLFDLPLRVTPLSDGRMVSVGGNPILGGNLIQVFTASGAPQRGIKVDLPSSAPWYARQLSADKMLIATKATATGWNVSVVDLNTGETVRHEQGLAPTFIDRPFDDARRPPMNADQLFADAKGSIVHWNPITNEKNVLIASRR